MAIAAKISSTELTTQVTDRFAGKYLEARLINAPGTSYQPGITNDANFLTFEAPIGVGGYGRQVIGYSASDVSPYADDGVGLATKATIFAQDGSADGISFTHAALTWSEGNVLTTSSVGLTPSAGNDGTYTNIPVTTDGTGTGLTVDLTISNSGASTGDYVVTIVSPGEGHSASDICTISDEVLNGVGAVSVGAGPLGFGILTVSENAQAGLILAVAQTSSATVITAGNEAIFYWNLKQFGFYSV